MSLFGQWISPLVVMAQMIHTNRICLVSDLICPLPSAKPANSRLNNHDLKKSSFKRFGATFLGFNHDRVYKYTLARLLVSTSDGGLHHRPPRPHRVTPSHAAASLSSSPSQPHTSLCMTLALSSRAPHCSPAATLQVPLALRSPCCSSGTRRCASRRSSCC